MVSVTDAIVSDTDAIVSDINSIKNDINVLSDAIADNKIDVVKMYIERLKSYGTVDMESVINSENIEQYNIHTDNALIHWADIDNLEMIELLIDEGASMYTYDDNQRSFIYNIIHGDHMLESGKIVEHLNVQCMELLIAKGYDVNRAFSVDECLVTPLISLCDKGEYIPYEMESYCSENRLTIAKLLIDAGANVNKGCESCGITPLHNACKTGRVKLVQLLIKSGANVNAICNEDVDDVDGSPLNMACYRCEFPEIVKVLLDNGADLNIMSYYYKKNKKMKMTPLELVLSADYSYSQRLKRLTETISITKMILDATLYS